MLISQPAKDPFLLPPFGNWTAFLGVSLRYEI